MEEDRDFLSYSEAAKLLNVSRSTVWRWVRLGKNGAPPVLRGHKLGPRVVRIAKSDVDALLAAATTPGDATPYDKAAARVDASPALAPYRDFIMADGPDGDDHWRWVATATEREIIDWAEAASTSPVV